MGQKVNPHGFRVGINKDWNSRWYANKKDFSDFLVEDYKIRQLIKSKLYLAKISHIEIERTPNETRVIIYSGRPGAIIGKGGAGLEELSNELRKKFGKEGTNINVSVVEIKKQDLNAQLVAENIAFQLEKRISFRRAMKQAMQRTMKAGAKGIKVSVSGRLGGAEMARTEFYKEGMIPLQTIRADIDYGFAEAQTTYGKLGVKVWIYKGEILTKSKELKGGNENGLNA